MLTKRRVTFGGARYCCNDECSEYAEHDGEYCLHCAPEERTEVLTDREIFCPEGIDGAAERLAANFGATFIDEALIQRIEQLTGEQAHPFLTSGLFCAHRSLVEILDAYEAGEPFYLYTGRGPSDDMHVGHLVPFLFTAYLQRVFDAPCIIQLTDDEKYLYKGLSFAECGRLVKSNTKDIIACGFNPEKTFIFSNFEEAGRLYRPVCEIQRHLTCNQVRATFGVEGMDSPGRMAFPAMEMAPALATTFPDLFGNRKLRCLVPCGIDQDPYFRLTRDVAQKMGHHKPATIESKFLPALAGTHTKMSSGGSSIHLSDDRDTIFAKIKASVSGGRECLQDQIKYGAILENDVALRYMRVFAEVAYPSRDGPVPPARSMKLSKKMGALDLVAGDIDAVEEAYGSGSMVSSEVKAMCADVVAIVVEQHRARRALVSDQDTAAFMARRPLL